MSENNKLEQGKNYRWEPTDKIEISGAEFDIFQRSIALFEGALIFQAALQVRTDIIARMVEAGVAKEFDSGALSDESAPSEPETLPSEPEVSKS